MDILAGALLLLFGRSLFWLFVGCIGFLVGFEFASDLFQQQPEWLIVAIAIGVGLLGAIASVFVQHLVVGIAGFFAGGYFLSTVAVTAFSTQEPVTHWIAYLIGGIIGAMLTIALLDPALIILSSLAGATAIAQNVPLNEAGRGIVFIALLVFGIMVQATQYRQADKSSKTERRE
jgi:hypothetical protein